MYFCKNNLLHLKPFCSFLYTEHKHTEQNLKGMNLTKAHFCGYPGCIVFIISESIFVSPLHILLL